MCSTVINISVLSGVHPDIASCCDLRQLTDSCTWQLPHDMCVCCGVAAVQAEKYLQAAAKC